MSHSRIGCDTHKWYSLFALPDARGRVVRRVRVDHRPHAFRPFLSQVQPGAPVALETVGNWYEIGDDIGAAGCAPRLAKRMMGHVHHTDKLSTEGLATLLHLGSLPTVWIPLGELRDERGLPRTRIAFSNTRSRLKSRILATLAKYGLSVDTQRDVLTRKWREPLLALVERLPQETDRRVQQELELLDLVQQQIHRLVGRFPERVKTTPSIRLVMTVPAPAEILSIAIERVSVRSGTSLFPLTTSPATAPRSPSPTPAGARPSTGA